MWKAYMKAKLVLFTSFCLLDNYNDIMLIQLLYFAIRVESGIE